MQRKNRIRYKKMLCLAGALVTACAMCGCTRKEELLLLTETAAAEEAAAREDAVQESGESKSTDQSGVSPALEDNFAARERTVSAENLQVQEETAGNSILYVHICGAVEAPGVYELPAGSRVYEAVQAAGGFSAEAEQDYVNQAQILTDGVKLVIPTVEEAAMAKGAAATEGKEPVFSAAGEKSETAVQIGIVGSEDVTNQSVAENGKQAGGRININTATEQELCEIPGVGETRAAAIISYRESHGGFTKPEDIMKVNGIKEGMYEKIKDSISVD